MAINTDILLCALQEIGTSEVAGDGDNPRIVEYHAATSLKATADEVPWCSAFVNWCCKQAGVKGTNSAAARSWLTHGKECEPIQGAITVLWRGDKNSASGHVGILLRATDSDVWLIGGNQGDSVTVAKYPRSRVLSFRELS